jgi:hypothetical protein
MFTLSALTSLIVTVVDHATSGARRAPWAWLTTTVFACGALLSVFHANLGMFSLLALALVRLAEVRLDNENPARPPSAHIQPGLGGATS